MAAVFVAAPAQLDAAVDQRLQHVAIERLLDEVEGGAADGAHELLVLVVDAAGHQDDVDVGVQRLQTRHQLEAVELRHADVENGEVGSAVGRDARSASRDEPLLITWCAAPRTRSMARSMPGSSSTDQNAGAASCCLQRPATAAPAGS